MASKGSMDFLGNFRPFYLGLVGVVRKSIPGSGFFKTIRCLFGKLRQLLVGCWWVLYYSIALIER